MAGKPSNTPTVKRSGELRVQVDRWPLCEAPSEHILTVIVVGHYTGKPNLTAIHNALIDACTLLAAQEQEQG